MVQKAQKANRIVHWCLTGCLVDCFIKPAHGQKPDPMFTGQQSVYITWAINKLMEMSLIIERLSERRNGAINLLWLSVVSNADKMMMSSSTLIGYVSINNIICVPKEKKK